MQLALAIAALEGARLVGDGGVDLDDLTLDSRQVRSGMLFCCVAGTEADGHAFAADALRAGARALLVERELEVDAPQVIVSDSRRGTALVAATMNENPSRSMSVVGVTGTNGKTTTTHLLANVLNEAGTRTEVLGTLTGVRTTPEAPDLQRQLAQWRDAGVEAVAMEVSSHALSLHRVDGMRFRVGVFTNLSRDHLDFHGTMEAYFQAKARLFTPDFADRAVVNLDSPYGRLLADACLVPTTGFALDDVELVQLSASGSEFRWRGRTIHLRLGGEFNVANAVAAASAASALGLGDAAIAAGLSRPIRVPGRFDAVEVGQPFAVLVDFAHTPDGLERLLAAASPLVGTGPARRPGRVVVVFGCGGERDVDKRSLMGEVAADGADRVVVTSDNSRGEATDTIIDAVRRGYERVHRRRSTELRIEPDRRAAIAGALAGAAPGDVVVLAGKGHETTQDLGDVVVAFDDRAVAIEELAQLGWGA